MRSFKIVMSAPALDLLSGVVQRPEPILIQALGSMRLITAYMPAPVSPCDFCATSTISSRLGLYGGGFGCVD